MPKGIPGSGTDAGSNPLMVTTTGRKRRGRRARKTATTGNGPTTAIAGKQYLSLPRNDRNTVISDHLTAGQLLGFINAVCAVDRKQHGIVGNDPTWAYNLGVTMLSAE